MSRFDERNPHPQEAGGRDYSAGDDFGSDRWTGEGREAGRRQPGHKDFGGHHAYQGLGRQPGHRDFGRHETASLYGGDGRDWSASGYPGGHRGVGPKGYIRSDERVREDVCERLAGHDAIDASGIEVSVTDGVVRLTGEVPARYMKHLAEDAAAEGVGVKDVENTLKIAASASR